MACHLSRDAQILWKKLMREFRFSDIRAYEIQADESFFRFYLPHIRHCSSCDFEWTGESDCPACGGEAF